MNAPESIVLTDAQAAGRPQASPLAPDFADNPYATYARWRDEGRLLWSNAFFGGAWLLTRHADVENSLRDPRLSAQRTGGWVMDVAEGDRAGLTPFQRLFTRALLFLDAPEHTRLRQVLMPAFRPQRLQALQPEIEQFAAELVAGITPGQDFDFMERIARPLPVRVIARLMGVDLSLEQDFMRWADDIAAFIGAVRPTAEQTRLAQRSTLEMAGSFERELLPRRRREPQDDLVTELVQARDDGRISSDAELLAQCAMLLFAGYETTRNLLGNGMLVLMQHRAQWEQLCRQPELVPGSIRELLRFDSPVQWTGRRVASSFTLHGQQLRRGELVLPMIGCANHDPARHAGPETLDVQRENPGALSFGSGPHVCIGAALTQLEAQTLFTQLVQRLPGLQLAGEVERNGNPVYRGILRLPMRLPA